MEGRIDKFSVIGLSEMDGSNLRLIALAKRAGKRTAGIAAIEHEPLEGNTLQ
jgi:hypothetical protein